MRDYFPIHNNGLYPLFPYLSQAHDIIVLMVRLATYSSWCNFTILSQGRRQGGGGGADRVE